MASIILRNSRFIAKLRCLRPIVTSYQWNSCHNRNYASATQNNFYASEYLRRNQKSLLHINKSSIHTSPHRLKIVPFLLADIGEGIKEVVLREWFVKEGDRVSQFENICEVQSDKASVTITSRYDGIVQKLYCPVDGIALVGHPLLDIEVEKEESATVGDEVQEREAIPVGSPSPGGGPPEQSIHLPKEGSRVLTTPAVRRIAMQNKVDLNRVQGTGKDGRILKEDILKFIDQLSAPAAAPQPPAPPKEVSPPVTAPVPPPKPIPVILEKDKTVPIRGYTKAMVKTMTASNKIPHFCYCDEVDMSSLVDLRHDLKTTFKSHGLKFSYLPILIKAASMALLHFPVLNSSVDENCEKIIQKASHNIGFAMDTSEGLAVPNIKGVQQRSILEITEELMRLQACGQKGSFSTQDLSGGTFTLSNIGSIGGTYMKPLILPPEVVIGAFGKMQKVPRYNYKDEVVPCHVMHVTWSADHRVIDGATIARFSNLWKGFLEKPASMVTSMK